MADTRKITPNSQNSRSTDQDDAGTTAASAPAGSENTDDKKADTPENPFMNPYFLWLETIRNVQETQAAFERTAAHQAAIDSAYDYYKPQIDEANAEDNGLRIKDYDANGSEYDSGIIFRGPSGGRHGGSSTLAFGDMGKIAVGEKQNKVNDVLADAAQSAGVNLNTMRGIWNVESKFSSIREVSITGCSGAFQFTRGTWAENILKHGDEIAARLQAKGFNEDAAIAQKYHDLLVNKQISIKDEGLQSQRFNGHIATYASAYYIADIANRQNLDAKDAKQGGKLYAAYNVGEGALQTLIRLVRSDSGAEAMSVIGNAAKVNPMFYRGGATGTEALANYQAAMDNGAKQYTRIFGDQPDVQLASAKTAAKPEPVSFAKGEVPEHRQVASSAVPGIHLMSAFTLPASMTKAASDLNAGVNKIAANGLDFFKHLGQGPAPNA